jgi:hypothetical protein
MYKGSSTSFGYVEKVEDQVPWCGVHGGEAEGSRARQRAVAVAEEEEAGVEATTEETGIERRRGDRWGLSVLGWKRSDMKGGQLFIGSKISEAVLN